MKSLLSTALLGAFLTLASPPATAQYAYGDSYLYEDSSWHLEGYSITYNSYQLWFISVGVDAALYDPAGNVLASGSDTEWWNGLDAYASLAAYADAGLYYVGGHHYYNGDGWGPVDAGSTRYDVDTGEVYGAVQSALQAPGNWWNFRIAHLKEPGGGTVRARVWWSCSQNSSPNDPSICYGQDTGNGLEYVNTDIPAAQYGLCDIADPTVVKFNGLYYLYASALQAGSLPCPPGVQGGIVGFVSADARAWSILNNGQYVIASSYSGSAYYEMQPSAIVMQYSYACSAGNWAASTATPFIRVYYTSSDSGDPGYSLIAADSYDGVSFTLHLGPGGVRGILRGNGLASNGWWPNVKRVGSFGDYPLVITYEGPGDAYHNAHYTAVTNGAPSDFNWLGANGGHIQYYSPMSSTSVSLEGLGDGTLIDNNGYQFYGYPSGNVGLWWSAGTMSFPTPLYRGPASTLTIFPWLPYMNSCQP